MICDYYRISEITLEDANRIHEDYIKARRSWIAEIKKDAEKEYAMGDVEEEVYRNFVEQSGPGSRLRELIHNEELTIYN